MAEQGFEVDISRDGMCLSLRCTLDTRNLPLSQYIYSSYFQFGFGRWRLGYSRGSMHNLVLLRCSGVFPDHLHVWVHGESTEDGRTVEVLPQEKHITTQYSEERDACNYIWQKEEYEIHWSVPEYRQHGILRLMVDLRAGEDDECLCATCQFIETDDNVPSLESFLKDLGDILDQNDSTDMEFRCADADGNILTTVRAHKFLVCARSPVLAAMLHNDMVEGRTGVATIKDIDAGVFEQFLKYLYSGKLGELTAETATSLYEAGDRFQVKGLTKHCAKWMVRNLTIENSCEVLLLADAHSDEEFAKATLAFMANQKVPQVFNGWEDFCRKNPELSNRVLWFSNIFAKCSREWNHTVNNIQERSWKI